MLREQCKSWMGITSVAVYWPLMFFQPNNTASLREAINTVQDFHRALEGEGAASVAHSWILLSVSWLTSLAVIGLL